LQVDAATARVSDFRRRPETGGVNKFARQSDWDCRIRREDTSKV
jgi:hypothetical protein